ncbi:MAG: DUF1460 domain-containing protein [Alphaproteobacteria bacterium]|nr:DUF1460 domain-containing protein [Alphaproteobacteria bacterium]MBN2780012.1 DUF1460 domain-containing protein [Alphaproteobacteria bacterium]
MKKILLILFAVCIGCISKEKPMYNIKDLEQHSEKFIGIRYQDSPLGEGPNALYDKDPLFRFDRFDCLTYVETVMAIYFSENNKKSLNKYYKKFAIKTEKFPFQHAITS